MKYIRTKDGICELDDNWALFCQEYANNKQANTIRELCDTFICESNEEGNNFTKTYEDLFQMLRDDYYQRFRSHYNFYGAIHVKEKGSIYVAKLNEEGALELI